MIADKSILLVDDDESIRTSMTYFFRKKTRRFKSVPSAEAALALLQTDQDWNVVVCDFKLPGMNGIVFLDQAKRVVPHVKTALITAYATMDIVTEALRAGIHDFIQKPLKAGMIADAIERMTGMPREAAGEVVLYAEQTSNQNPPPWREDLEFTIQKVTHQMNNAFTALRGKAELGLCKSPLSEDSDKFSEILDILTSVENLNKELMSFGKALTQRSFKPVDVMDLIRRRTFAHAAMMHKAGVRLCLKNAGGGPFWVTSSEEPLTHILDNILINAVQGLAEVGDRPRELTVSVAPQNDKVLVQVRDNGIGMDPETLEKACWNGFTTKPDGHGLGLFITKRLCRVIHASLGMQSRQGEGTSVTLTLPCHSLAEGRASNP